eukprot:9603438-Heterocapsa_arctica.AAC.1
MSGSSGSSEVATSSDDRGDERHEPRTSTSLVRHLGPGVCRTESSDSWGRSRVEWDRSMEKVASGV